MSRRKGRESRRPQPFPLLLVPAKKKTSASARRQQYQKIHPSPSRKETCCQKWAYLSLPLAVVHAFLHLVLYAICNLVPTTSINRLQSHGTAAFGPQKRYLIRGQPHSRACLAGSNDPWTQRNFFLLRTIAVMEANASIMMGRVFCVRQDLGKVSRPSTQGGLPDLNPWPFILLYCFKMFRVRTGIRTTPPPHLVTTPLQALFPPWEGPGFAEQRERDGALPVALSLLQEGPAQKIEPGTPPLPPPKRSSSVYP
ncbi:hypothetical protein QBC34DRAFT_39433 [Podospora aff. communis PSN243]|uniref:Uncharacterized protein n=1 Tax=Podospora aff. communis PSN243 TaxID=3040156 RepID=A0AAV9GZP7_9PEZI|nr:hypothetical protein QBC34DRAFT_39433 [Podospora aff. communis PSN243]